MLPARMYSDASAALGIIQRRGLGKLRHIDTSFLWLQETSAKRQMSFGKVAGSENPADVGTKHLGQELMMKHLESMHMSLREGRSDLAPALNMFDTKNTCKRVQSGRHSSRTKVQSMTRRDAIRDEAS